MEHELRVVVGKQTPKSLKPEATLAVAGILSVLALGLGCITDRNPAAVVPMCEVDDDCDSGEVCGASDGICYGNPPTTEFAGVLIPSGDKASNLVPTEIPKLSIDSEGTITGLEFARPVRIDGNVTLVCSVLTANAQVACGQDAPVDATIRVERSAGFAGGPRFRQNFPATAASENNYSFSLMLPPTTADLDGSIRPYTISIIPLAADEETSVVTAAEIAPPVVIRDFEATVDSTVEWLIGTPDDTRWVSSCLSGGAGVPDAFKSLSVVALAKEATSGESVIVSSLSKTDASGCFSLRVPKDLSKVDLRFQPSGTVAASSPVPRIDIVNESLEGNIVESSGGCFAGSPAQTLCMPTVRGPDLPATGSVTIPVAALAPEGGTEAVGGAAVTLRTSLRVPEDLNTPSRDSRVSATLEVRTSSSANSDSPTEYGQATVELPLNLTYKVTVIPGAESKFASRYEESRAFETGGVQEAIQLTRRVAASGRIVDFDGVPVANTTVAAEPSLSFTLAATSELRSALEGHRIETITDEDGNFFFWLEGQLDFGNGELSRDPLSYDLTVRPPFLAGPKTNVRNVSASTGATNLELGELRLPDGAFARGQVRDADGNPLIGVELNVWQPSSEQPCAAFGLPDGECPAAATRIDNRLSNETGEVSIVLPRER